MVSIWGSTSHSIIEPLQVLQNRAIRNVFRMESRKNRVEMYIETKILPIRALCVFRIVTFIHKCITGGTIMNMKFERQGGKTRGKNMLKKTSSKNNHGRS